MIELLGVAISAEMLITLGVAFLIDEILPFLPTKYNGILHAVVLGLQKSRIGRNNKSVDAKIDKVLSLMEKWDHQAEEITKNDRGRR